MIMQDYAKLNVKYNLNKKSKVFEFIKKSIVNLAYVVIMGLFMVSVYIMIVMFYCL